MTLIGESTRYILFNKKKKTQVQIETLLEYVFPDYKGKPHRDLFSLEEKDMHDNV